MFKEPRRARRIRLTSQVAHRRHSDRLTWWFGPSINGSDDIWPSDHFFAKIKALGCQKCSSRRKSRPKISGGMCKHNRRWRIYANRRADRTLAELSRRPGSLDWEADVNVLLCLPVKNEE